MSLATIYCRANTGIEAPLVTVEVHLANGLPAFSIVGLPEKAVQESRERVRSALLNAGFEFPARRITVNLAPADLPKEGGRFDLAIALGILSACGQIPDEPLKQAEFIGELNLSGEIRPVKALLPVALAACRAGRILYLPKDNYAEASLIKQARLVPVDHILSLSAFLCGRITLPEEEAQVVATTHESPPDLREIRGQDHAKRALTIAAAGKHNLLLSGPPGTGKSMLASRLPGILPLLTEAEALEQAMVRSICGLPFKPGTWRQPPFRSPHHTASGVALAGGGSDPRPGEASLAHQGVLFLDEIAEFQRGVLDVLREPLESGKISISRAARQAEFPARFQLVAAMNPCPCGHLGDFRHNCRCTSEQIARYQGRISGPLLDRIDLHVMVPPVPAEDLSSPVPPDALGSSAVREQVEKARRRQLTRQNCANAQLAHKQLEQVCHLDKKGHQLLNRALETLGLSPRAYHRILRVARTIADLTAADSIELNHLTEAISYRKLDRR